ncbi:MAG: hypothetical protein GEU99_13060 [Luteitalea sp.]|nr:hypothetical protein [Luteitalea sp.]
MDWLPLVLGSAGVGALVSAAVGGYVTYRIKRLDLAHQELVLAYDLTELKHRQLVAAQDWAIRSDGKARNLEFWDPMVTLISYQQALDEFKKTGTWSFGEDTHRESRERALRQRQGKEQGSKLADPDL